MTSPASPPGILENDAMSTALRSWALLVLLTTVPIFAGANELESGSTKPALPVAAQVPEVADGSASAAITVDGTHAPQAVPADDPWNDPLLDVEFGEDSEFGEPKVIWDPLEKSNRATFKFNRGVHRWVLSPITTGYQFVVPEPARKTVRRMLVNLNSPAVLVNDLLQLRFKDAGKTFGRFLLNSTIGMGGMFDVGIEAGWEYHNADFGQTLARMGVVSGPYLVIPVLGPNTLRDGFGDIVDLMFQPLTYIIGPTTNLFLGGGRGFVELEAKSAAMEALEESSVDYYAALRSAYIQNRNAEIEQPDHSGLD